MINSPPIILKKRRIYKNFRMISTGREEFIDLKAAERIDFEGR